MKKTPWLVATLASSLLVPVVGCGSGADPGSEPAVARAEAALAPNCTWITRALGDFEIAPDPEFAPSLLLVTNVGNGASNYPVTVSQLSGADGSVVAGPVTVAENYTGLSIVNGPELSRLPAGGPVRMGVLYHSPRGVSGAWRVSNPPSWDAFVSKLDGQPMLLPRVGPPLLDATPGDAYPGGGAPDDLSGYSAFGGTCAGLCYGRVAGAAGTMTAVHDLAYRDDGLLGMASTADAGREDEVLLSACHYDTTCAQSTCPGQIACVAACAGNPSCLQGCDTACLATCANSECGVYRATVDGAGGLRPLAAPAAACGTNRALGYFAPVECTTYGAPRETLRAGKPTGSNNVYTFVKDGADIVVMRSGVPSVRVASYANAEHFRTVGGPNGQLVMYYQVRDGANRGGYEITIDENAVPHVTHARFTDKTYGVELVYFPQAATPGFAYYALEDRPLLGEQWITRCTL